MNKKQAKKEAYAIVAAAARGASRAYEDPKLREALEALAGSLGRHASRLPTDTCLGGPQGQAAVVGALGGCQQALRPLAQPQRQAVMRGLHAWYCFDISRTPSVADETAPC